MIDDPAQKEDVLKKLEKRDPRHFEACPKRKCGSFDIVEVGPNVMMAFCHQHGYQHNILVQ